MISSCRLCPRACNAKRDAGETGVCMMDSRVRVALAAPHCWEEPCISGTRGSGAIFFVGCPLGCVYCQNRAISRGGNMGRELDSAGLAQCMRSLEEQGVHNINFVTGTHYIPAIIAALRIHRPAVPVVWNSSGYESLAAVDAIAPWVDIWLPDYKYALSEPAERYSAAPDYPETAMAAIRRMRFHQPENVTDADGILRKGMIVRHLVLPLNTRNSVAALGRIAAELPGTPVSLMSQYTPVTDDDSFPELRRRITAREYEKVCGELLELELDGYVQERESSKAVYIPKWDT